jgi:hypothetical protein
MLGSWRAWYYGLPERYQRMTVALPVRITRLAARRFGSERDPSIGADQMRDLR